MQTENDKPDTELPQADTPPADKPVSTPTPEAVGEPLAPEESATTEAMISQPMTIVDLLRHGQVATPNLFCAPVNEPLGIPGWKQLTVATQNGQWDVIISSPTRRCHDFARLLAQRMKCDFVVEPMFGEMNFGHWIGQTQTALWEKYPELMQQLWSQPRRFNAPGGERMEDFINRVTYAWKQTQLQYAGQRVLILTHAGVIRVILSTVLEIIYQKSLRFEVDYAQFSRIHIYPDGVPSLVGHGLPNVPN